MGPHQVQFFYPSAVIPHITIVARLEGGETLPAKSDGAPYWCGKKFRSLKTMWVMQKLKFPMDLTSLQGTIVPTLYRVIYDQKYRCVVLLMERS